MNNDKPKSLRLLEDLLNGQRYVREQYEASLKGQLKVEPLLAELSEECELNAFGGTYWFTTPNRSDLTVLMKLAPIWNKSTEENTIRYHANVDGVPYWITALDGALPPTCKLVEQEVLIPAQPERTVKKMVVQCSTAVQLVEEICPFA